MQYRERGKILYLQSTGNFHLALSTTGTHRALQYIAHIVKMSCWHRGNCLIQNMSRGKWLGVQRAWKRCDEQTLNACDENKNT